MPESRFMNFFKFRSSSFVYLVGVSVVLLAALTVTGGLGLWSVEDEMKKNLERRLRATLSANVKAFKIWANDKKRDAQVLSREPAIREKVLAILEQSRNENLTPELLRQSEETVELRKYLAYACQKYGFNGFFLIDPTGLQVGAMFPGLIGKRHLVGHTDFFYRSMQGDTVISHPFAAATVLTDEKGVAWKHNPMMVASTPIRNAIGEIIGVLAFQMRPEDEFTEMFKVSQTGKTEETIVFDNEGTMLSESLFVEDIRRARLIPNGPKSLSILNLQLRDPGGNLNEGHRPELPRNRQPLTRMAANAVKGGSGVDLDGYNDYRGVPVVGAWTWLKNFDLGVATKMDVTEALGPLKTIKKTFALEFYLLIFAALLGLSLRARQFRIEEERNQAEKRVETGEVRMQAVMDNVNDGILTFDDRGLIETFNSGAEKMFGLKFDEAQGKNVLMLMPESYRTQYDATLQKYRQSGQSNMLGANLEVKGLRKDGSIFPAELTVNEMHLDGNRMFTGIVRDITERKKSEEALIKAYADLQLRSNDLAEANNKLIRSNTELDDFAYVTSHDLKEPLRGIHNYSTFLLEDYSDKIDEEGKNKLQTLIRLTQRLESFINSLLYYSRVGRIDLSFAETDLDAGLHEVLDSLHVTLEEKNIDVRIPRPLPTLVCDQARVTEVFRNLITNAMKYNDKPEKWIEIGTCLKGENSEADTTLSGNGNGSELVFYVRDNGIGIREKHLDSVFRIFKRLHGRDKFGGGTGAGLTIVKKIVERHGGRVWVDSTFGEGTTFYFTLQGEQDGGGYANIDSKAMHFVG